MCKPTTIFHFSLPVQICLLKDAKNKFSIKCSINSSHICTTRLHLIYISDIAPVTLNSFTRRNIFCGITWFESICNNIICFPFPQLNNIFFKKSKWWNICHKYIILILRHVKSLPSSSTNLFILIKAVWILKTVLFYVFSQALNSLQCFFNIMIKCFWTYTTCNIYVIIQSEIFLYFKNIVTVLIPCLSVKVNKGNYKIGNFFHASRNSRHRECGTCDRYSEIWKAPSISSCCLLCKLHICIFKNSNFCFQLYTFDRNQVWYPKILYNFFLLFQRIKPLPHAKLFNPYFNIQLV